MMKPTRKAIVLLACLALLGLATIPTPMQNAGSEQRDEKDCPAGEKYYEGIGCAVKKEKGGYKVKLKDGREYDVHGPDTMSHPETASDKATSSAYYECRNTDRRVQLAYVKPSDRADRYAIFETDIRQYFYWAANTLQARFAAWGASGTLKIPVHCKADGTPSVIQINSANPNNSNFYEGQQFINAGHNDPNVLYWSVYDGTFQGFNSYSGVASGASDDDSPTSPEGNKGPEYAYTMYAGGGGTMLHEAFHTWNAVSNYSPNASGGHHCTDEDDLMCYSDSPNYPPMRNVCPSPWKIDCNGDDYFRPDPPAGSYLATKWNVAGCGNYFLRRTGCTYPGPYVPPTTTTTTTAPPTTTTTAPPSGAPSTPTGLDVDRSVFLNQNTVEWNASTGTAPISYRLYWCSFVNQPTQCEIRPDATPLYDGPNTNFVHQPVATSACYQVSAYSAYGTSPRSEKVCRTFGQGG